MTARPAKQTIAVGANFAWTKQNLVALANSNNAASREDAFRTIHVSHMIVTALFKLLTINLHCRYIIAIAGIKIHCSIFVCIFRQTI